MRQPRGLGWLAWGICTGLVVSSVITLIVSIREQMTAQQIVANLLGTGFLFPLLFAIPGALIISRHPRHPIGWLLLGPAPILVASDWMSRYLQTFKSVPPPSTLPIWIMILFSSSSWLALIFPLMLIPLTFPTGKPLTPRWRWVARLALGMILFFFAWAVSMRVYRPDFASWTMVNPIGFMPKEAETYIMPVWTFLLAVLTVACLASLVIRYRRASTIERQQMKWLLYACAIFVAVYIPSLYAVNIGAFTSQAIPVLINFLFELGISAIPLSIAIAILRYHLFDIDVIIRLTLVYALVTGLLGLTYAGGIVLLQDVFRLLTGQTSSLAVVITTLAIAALFNPLRLRAQNIIDRRFYRQKYNAEQSLAEFALAARSGSDLDTLTGMLVEITQKTLQPAQVGLQLMDREEKEA